MIQRIALLLAVAVPVATSWSAPALAATDASKAMITGSATYRERVALTPSAVFEATLEDVSRADAAGNVIAHVRIVGPGQVPIAFEIPYDPRRIDSGRAYVVRATIHEDGRLRFTSDGARPVLTRGYGSKVAIRMRGTPDHNGGRDHGRDRNRESALGSLPATFIGLLPCDDCVGIRYQINLMSGGAYMQRMTHLRSGHDASYYQVGAWTLSDDGSIVTLKGGGDTQWAVQNSRRLRKLDQKGNPIDSRRNYDLTRSAVLQPMDLRVRLMGMFRYMADAARFRDCVSGLQWPVAMSDDYPALERAYAGRRTTHGSELPVLLNGRIEQRRKMEGDGNEATLVVERFLGVESGAECGERDRPAGLEDTRWRPVRIGDRTVTVSGEQREPWIVLQSRSKRVTGSGGCNRISGGYEARNGTLRFGPLISTKMACASMETETAFFRALDLARRYRVQGRVLELLDERGKLLARLEERSLR